MHSSYGAFPPTPMAVSYHHLESKGPDSRHIASASQSCRCHNWNACFWLFEVRVFCVHSTLIVCHFPFSIFDGRWPATLRFAGYYLVTGIKLPSPSQIHVRTIKTAPAKLRRDVIFWVASRTTDLAIDNGCDSE